MKVKVKALTYTTCIAFQVRLCVDNKFMAFLVDYVLFLYRINSITWLIYSSNGRAILLLFLFLLLKYCLYYSSGLCIL